MEKLKPEKLIEMLKSKGIDMSVEEATSVLEYLRKLANIVVVEFMNKDKPRK
ncbi:hypothetical protein [Parachryseolinea silvisoli]|uniref:hypothetical protein n=1 Tax=Parachryseolinea silvisoli TaxID=2873601 RepID=UPI002265BFAF|nr:hypothetical protein [Parachryseolinea silvisoli]MCD9015252.1 hypothetical protein [Parachryseolinea silvisoli]